MLDGRTKNEKTNLVNENKSSLPSDDTSPSSKDLDDEIPFKNKWKIYQLKIIIL